MKDKELKLNASGYRDEPCYQTIKAVDVPKPGEIYIHADTGKYVLVLSCVNGVCAILNLTEQEREGRIPVMARVQMYTNPIMINYTFATTLGQYVKTITDDECLEVKMAVANALGLDGLSVPVVPHDHINALEDKVKALKDNINELEAKNITQEANISLLKKQVKLLEGERDKAMSLADGIHAEHIQTSKDLGKEKAKSEFYREMYDALIDKVISARGGKRK